MLRYPAMYKVLCVGFKVAAGLVGLFLIYLFVSADVTGEWQPILAIADDAGPTMSAGWRALRGFATPSTEIAPATATNRNTPQPPAQKAGPTAAGRTSLARELLGELKRVGCYEGEIHSEWTTSARVAMKAFTARVNAKLPTNAPDPILLSLVQAYQGKACGVACPVGQELAGDGGCVPTSILAHANKLTPPASADNENRSAQPPPPEGRMALAGPAAGGVRARSAPPQAATSGSSFVRALFRHLDRASAY